jgi:CheY-like chemotaxis protein
MTPDVIARVFEPFFTTKAVGRGSGLGLSMVFGMAHQSGGTVLIASTPGQGSSVTILLRRAEGALPLENPAKRAVEDDLRHLAGRKILLVDDEAMMREVVGDMLDSFGCSVITAKDGEQALARIASDAPEALLLDFAMPGMNGADVARVARARQPDLPIVFATGFARSEAIDAVMGDAAIILRKPFSPSALAEALRRALVK